MAKKKPAPKTTSRRINALIKSAGGKKEFNRIRSEAKKAQEADERDNLFFSQQTKQTNFEKNENAEKEFIKFAEKYSQLPATTEKEKAIKKLYAKEIDNYNKKRNREIKAVRNRYENKISELSGASLKDASPEFKKEIRALMDEQITANNKLRAVKEKTGARQKFELKYNENTDEVTEFKAWQQAEFENMLLQNPYVTNINGIDIKEDADKITDLIGKMFQRMDSTKLAGIRNLKKDGHVKIFFADEADIDGAESEF